MLKQKHSVTVPGLDITIETGTLAKQANGSVTVRCGETQVFIAATAAGSLKPDQDYFPLQVDYREKFSAAGRFPGGYFKREGRPSEKEILTSRLCDRPLRPLFPKGFMNEVQVLCMLLSADLEHEPDVLVVNGASAALMVSDIPWNGPVGCVRVGLIDDEFVVNPTNEQMFDSDLDLIYVGNEKEMMMIEGSAEEIPEERFIEALNYAQEQIQPIIAAQRELAAKIAIAKKEFKLIAPQDESIAFCRDLVGPRLQEAVFIPVKQEREAAVKVLEEEAAEALKTKVGEEHFDKNEVRMSFEILQEELYRRAILDEGKRADGRAPIDLREIEGQVGVLPRVHGSALFQRGETQNIAICTLGTTGDAQDLDGLTGGAKEKSFILHYNFPPYSVGETGRVGTPGRREVGHGALAERSLLPVMPSEEDFPYAVRVVSEIMESNGSTSMASVCGGCLALMDAGVPISDLVAGISVGLVARKEGDEITKYEILTDIIGAEDHFGDMDFKICGTRNGITGFQLDLKIPGLSQQLTREAIERNTQTRYKILDIMEGIMDKPRENVSQYAPRIHQIQIEPDKIGALIGPGGKTIRRIQEVSGSQIDINEDNSGKVSIYATSTEGLERALEEIKVLTAEIELETTYRGLVRSVKDFGVFVECLPGKEGMVHVSELADVRINHPEDVAAVGDYMWVKCIGIDDRGRVRLSRKAALEEREGDDAKDSLTEKVEAVRERVRARMNDDSGDGEGEEGEGEGNGERRERRDGGGGRGRGRGGRGGGGGGRGGRGGGGRGGRGGNGGGGRRDD